MRAWITRPLKKREAIFDRHDAVDELTRSRAVLDLMIQRLGAIADLERLAARVTLRTATPRECLTLADSLMAVDDLRGVMEPLRGPLLRSLIHRLDPVADAVAVGEDLLQLFKAAFGPTRNMVTRVCESAYC